MKILHISDTHGYHDLLTIPLDIDMIIHSGDCSNYPNPVQNYPEVQKFLEWFGNLPVRYKIYVAGNHDASIYFKHIHREDFDNKGICYLENEEVRIENIRIWGSPYTPTFGNWSFMKGRDKMHNLWQNIPENIDILVTHGPPKHILDLTENRNHELEVVGDLALLKRVKIIHPKYHLFGHIHNCEDIQNAGVLKLSAYSTIFSNGSVVTDNKFGTLSSNGNIIIL